MLMETQHFIQGQPPAQLNQHNLRLMCQFQVVLTSTALTYKYNFFFFPTKKQGFESFLRFSPQTYFLAKYKPLYTLKTHLFPLCCLLLSVFGLKDSITSLENKGGLCFVTGL